MFSALDTPSSDPSIVPPSPSPSGRPKVVIEDAHPMQPKNPLFPYLVGLFVIASLLLVGLIGYSVYASSKYTSLEQQYDNVTTTMDKATVTIHDLQAKLDFAEQETSLYRGDQANLTTALISVRENYTDALAQVGECQNTLLIAQGEVRRLQNLQLTNCDTLTNEVKSDCNLALDRLFANVTAACGDTVDEMPDASGSEITDEMQDRVDLDQYKFPGVS